MPFYKITLGYDGTRFSGWQTQPNDRTVQETVEHAWTEITGESVRLTASSRTDAGVHALGQVAGVKTDSLLSAETLLNGLNAKLPEDVVVHLVEAAPAGFHATRDAKQKRYRYQIHNDRRRPLLERRYVWHVIQRLDAAAMHEAAQALVGKHDFRSFQTTGSKRQSTVRTIFSVNVTRECSRLSIEVEGDGFLYNMVRILAGTLVEVGRGRRSVGEMPMVLAACDRGVAGQTAPPQGLTLLDVEY